MTKASRRTGFISRAFRNAAALCLGASMALGQRAIPFPYSNPDGDVRNFWDVVTSGNEIDPVTGEWRYDSDLNWKNLGVYFPVAIQNNPSAEGTEKNRSFQRFKKIATSYVDFLYLSKRDFKEHDPRNVCIAAREASYLAGLSSPETVVTLTTEQLVLVQLLRVARRTPENTEAIQAMIDADGIYCVDNNSHDRYSENERLGYYWKGIIAVELNNAGRKMDLHPLTSERDFAALFEVFMHESGHGYEFLATGKPIKIAEYARPFGKLAELVMEAMAELFGRRALVLEAIRPAGNDEKIKFQPADIPNYPDAAMSQIDRAYASASRDVVNGDGKILGPAFASIFYSRDHMRAYETEACREINAVPATNTKPMPMDLLLTSYGPISGMKGNVLQDVFGSETLGSVQNRMAGAGDPPGLTTWFDSSVRALEEGRPVPDFFPDKKYCRPAP